MAELWRHPVKSMQGERVSSIAVGADGFEFDRSWAVRDRATGKVLTGRRVPELLLASATVIEGRPVITLPDGSQAADDEALSRWLARDVELVEPSPGAPGVAEFFADALDETSELVEWTMPPTRFVDALPLLVLTTSSLGAARQGYPEGDWNVRRFRPNVLLDTAEFGDGWLEDGWAGKALHCGSGGVVIRPLAQCERCTMVVRAQPGGLERDSDIFKSLARGHGKNLGMWSIVATPGEITEGEPVELGE